MNLNDQIVALDAGVDQLIHAAHAAEHATRAAEAAALSAAARAEAAERAHAALADAAARIADAPAAAEPEPAPEREPAQKPEPAQEPEQKQEPALLPEPEPAPESVPDGKPTLEVSRPSQNELTLTVNGQSITLHPQQLGQLIEELAHARASMQPEPPTGLPPGWRFVSTKNPMMAVQKQSNGDRLLVARHTGYGWVPFTLSPDVVIQMYMMLTQR